MIRVAIVEDDREYIAELKEYLRRYELENKQSFKVSAFLDGDEIVRSYESNFDIVLMDIEMKFMDGMSAAEEIRNMDKEVIIIFITNMSQYAIKGYQVNAFDYVLKPISYFAFSQRLMRAIERLKERNGETVISFLTKAGTIRMGIDDILYIESQGHSLFIHTKSQIHEVTGTIKDMEDRMREYHFFRSNRGYLINMNHVEAIEEKDVLINGERLLISRSRKKVLLSALALYWGDNVK